MNYYKTLTNKAGIIFKLKLINYLICTIRVQVGKHFWKVKVAFLALNSDPRSSKKGVQVLTTSYCLLLLLLYNRTVNNTPQYFIRSPFYLFAQYIVRERTIIKYHSHARLPMSALIIILSGKLVLFPRFLLRRLKWNQIRKIATASMVFGNY